MPNLTLGNIFSMKVSTWTNNQLGLSVLHYRVAAVTGLGITEQEAANNFDANIAPLIKALIVNSANYIGIGVRNLSSVPPSAGAVSTISAGPGTAGILPLPMQTSGLMKWVTGFSGRNKRGRIYIPFPSTADNTGLDTPTLGYITRLGLYATGLLAPGVILGGAGSITPVLVIKPRVGLAVTDVTTFVPREAWATQRRRGTLGRPNPQVPAV